MIPRFDTIHERDGQRDRQLRQAPHDGKGRAYAWRRATMKSTHKWLVLFTIAEG